jgi:hypothetical protein
MAWEGDGWTFADLVHGAAEVGLRLVCDARLAASSLALLPPAVRALGEELPAARAQALADVARNTFLRVPIFVKGAQPRFDPAALRSLSFARATGTPEDWCLDPPDIVPGERARAVLDALGDTALPFAELPGDEAALLELLELDLAVARA